MDNATLTIRQVVPDEQWQLAIEFWTGEFRASEFRLFRADKAHRPEGFDALAYPTVFKMLTYDAAAVRWTGIGAIDAATLYLKSAPMSEDQLRRHVLRVGYHNRAPTTEDPAHHVYGVYLTPFDPAPFCLGESIGGGHAERGGSQSYGLAELRARPDWQGFFELSGCDWAIPIVQDGGDIDVILDRLIRAICARGGM
jgi:hypothetical protein